MPLRRLRVLLAGRMQQRLTRGGWVFAAASVLVGFAAFASANNLLFLLLATMLATLLVSGLVSRLSLSGLSLNFVLPDHISARRRIAARIQVRNQKGWLSSFSIRVKGAAESVFASPVYFPAIPAGATVEETRDVTFSRRGTHRENSFRFTSQFPFGFTERGVDVMLPREILVYPCIDPQPGFEEMLMSLAGELEARTRGRGHDFYRIRPYIAFESARHVDWKATAHTGEPQVREFARDEDPQLEIFLDLNVPSGGEAWFERAVEVCAFLAWRVSHMEARLRLRTQDFQLSLPAEGDVYTILKYLALVSAKGSKAPIGPPEPNSYPIVVSTQPERFVEAGWGHARLLGLDDLGGDGADVSAGSARGIRAGAGDDQHHGGRKAGR
jgi:uncharacterized protein (DUF58 family)